MNAIPEIKKTAAEEGYAQNYEAVRGDLPGDDWVKARREAAIRDFAQKGLPHRRIEAWKYTDLRMLLKNALSPAGRELLPVSDRDLYRALGAELHGFSAHHIVFVDGVYDEDNSFIIADEAGMVHVTPLSEILDQPPQWFKDNFGQADQPPGDPVVDLNTAFMRDGAAVEIVANAVLKRPLHLIFISSDEAPKAITERNLIHVADGAKATIIESYVHLRAPDAQRNCVTELHVGKGADIAHVKFQNEGRHAVHLSNWMVRIAEEATYRGFQFTLGGRLSRNGISVRFVGEGAHADISGVALLWDEQHSDTTLNVVHAVPSCTSRELFKAVLDDRARGIFQGKLVVEPDAKHTDAKQMARSLMLSDTAEFDAKPELEIYADDVACGHGATSGQIDEDMLFYMMQRGIPDERARSLLILAFIGEALEKIENEEVRHALQTATDAWLGTEAL